MWFPIFSSGKMSHITSVSQSVHDELYGDNFISYYHDSCVEICNTFSFNYFVHIGCVQSYNLTVNIRNVLLT